MAVDELSAVSQYFMRRLHLVRAAENLPASAKFDLARSPMSDDELEEIVDSFRDEPLPKSGWGLAEVFREYLSSEPKRVAVNDIKRLQENLKAEGYLPPEYEPTGVWDPTADFAAFRRFDRDNYQEMLQGKHFGASPIEAGVRLITNTLPSRVFQGLIGAAKGIVLQTPETLERGGALGGAAAGAGIGAAAGSVVPGIGTGLGALGGAVIGGAAGLIADLFGEDEGEEDQSALAGLVDVLSPFEEYAAQGPRAFFEDLGYTLSAASMVSGIGGAVRGTGTALRTLQAARQIPGGMQTAPSALPAIFGGAQGATAAAAPAAQLPLAKTLLAPGPTAELGLFGKVTQAAMRKAGVAPGTLAWTQNQMFRYSPFVLSQRLGPQVVQKAVSGLTQAQLGARLFGGMGAGTSERLSAATAAAEARLGRELTEDERMRIQAGVAVTTIEQEIAKAPVLPDTVDLAAFVFYPERLLPFKGTRIAAAARSPHILGDVSLQPIAHAIQHENPGMTLRKALEQAKNQLTPVDVAWLRGDYGIHRLAWESIDAQGLPVEQVVKTNAYSRARADVIRQVRKEFDASAKTKGGSETLERAVKWSFADPTDFEAWLIGLNGQGRGLSRMTDWKKANQLSRSIERQAVRSNVDPEISLLPEQIMTPFGPQSIRRRVHLSTARSERGWHMDEISLREGVRRTEQKASNLERAAKRSADNPWTETQLLEEARFLRREAAALKGKLKDVRKVGKGTRQKRVLEEYRIAPARLDYPDRDVLFGYAKQYDDLAKKAANATGLSEKALARQDFVNFVDDLVSKGLIDDRAAARAIKAKSPSDQIPKALISQAQVTARPLRLRPADMENFRKLGYKPVEAGDDLLFPDQLDQMTEVLGLGDYSRRAQVWETIGLSPRFRTDRSLFRLRREHEVAELQHVFDIHGIKMSPDGALRRIHEYKDKLNHDGAVFGPLAFRKSPDTGRIGLYKVDVRDLSPADIENALDSVPGMTDEVAYEVYGALRRGSAYGGELRFMHPVASARSIGHAMRLQGLTGFTDVVRTWHAEVPRRLAKNAFARDTYRYKPAADVVRSRERARVMANLDEVAGRTGIPRSRLDFSKAMLDGLARAQVKMGRFEAVDDVYRHWDVGFAEKYVADGVDALFKRVEAAPSLESLIKRFEAFSDHKDWYKTSADTLTELFGGFGKVRLRNHMPVSVLDLATQIIAASSPLRNPRDNLVSAMKNLQAFLRGDPMPAELPNVRRMIDEIFDGNVIDKWEQPFRTASKRIPRDRHFGEDGVVYTQLPTSVVRNERMLTKKGAGGVQYRVRQYEGGGTSVRDERYVRDLKANIQAHGIREPIMVEVAKDGKLWLLDGTHRAMLAEEIGLANVPVRFSTSGTQRALDTYDWLAKHAPSALRIEVPSGSRSRMKVYNFYQNLRGNFDKVTVDTWMARLFGIEGLTPKEYDQIADSIREIAKDRGVSPAEVQASLWASVKDETAKIAEAAGDHRLARAVRNEGGFAEAFVDNPQVQQLVEGVLDDLNGYALLQRVDDEILGATQFGPEFTTIMRFFRNADFSTLVHEDAHLLRRLLAPEDLKALEDFYGAKRAATAFKSTPVKVGRSFDEHGPEVFSRTKEGGGATWDPHTGSFVEGGQPGAGFAVAVEEGTGRLIAPTEAAFSDPVAFTAELKKFAKAKRQQLENPRNHIGTWADEDGIHLDISEVVPERDEAIRLGVLRKQKAAFDLETFEDVPTEGVTLGWTRAMEERFADDAEKYFTGKVDGIGPLVPLKEAVASLWAHVRPASVDTNLVPRQSRAVFDKYFGDALREIAPPRSKRIGRTLMSKQTVGGAALGAAAGATEGDDFSDIIEATVLGAGAGLITRGALTRTYGYLPDFLVRANTALRYTLSFTFDAGRYSEQNLIAMTKFGLPPMLSPRKHVIGRMEGWKSPFAAGKVKGDEAWDHAVKYWEELNGTSYFQNVDDVDRRMFQQGLLGFSPRNWEVAQAFQMYQKGWSSEKIAEAVSQIGRYGLGRTAAEKSANFVFFPFSFSKKLLSTMGDFMLQAPARNLLLHEGFRRYQSSELDEQVHDFLEQHAPLLKQLARINNLTYGISPGRFFLEELDDHRTNTGKVAQVLASFFVPSGAATPLAQAAGALGDWAVQAFTPVIITGESISRAGGGEKFADIIRDYVPFVRELDQYFGGQESAFQAQVYALLQGGAPNWQVQQYYDELRESKAELDPVAMAMGYSSTDGLLQSDMGIAFEPQMEAKRRELEEKYPTGFRMAQQFENTSAIDKRALYELAQRPDLSAAEERIVQISEEIERWQTIADLIGIDTQLSNIIIGRKIRELATPWTSDRRFGELYDRFFAREYGPIRRIA